MRRTLTALALATSLCATSAAASSALTGNDLIGSAKAYLEDKTNYESGLWLGIVLGLSAVYGEEIFEYAICYPKGSTNGQYAEVAAKYLLDHPEERHEPVDFLVFKSHGNAFGFRDRETCWKNEGSKSE